ncbi:hypothetical protein SLH49_12990 [Cognatiyoonia sp. IB215446]|uniref:hypothetical protein n=1 Tax=Cognatiyoonia sp. IB215446 TaxID=3097355 RepID=UPI002A170C63|nr:hypothetical protein [Cognatiyoonia sp. IB215446]MDX8348895.1 hypothetical protein [Cognatiyoonia sp. IB215446]
MTRDIIVAVVSSVSTAIILFSGGQAFDLFKVELDDAIAVEVGQQILTDPLLSRRLVTTLRTEEAFIGPEGRQGPAGPPWFPRGAIVPYERNAQCPDGSSRIANVNLQLRRNQPGYDDAVALSIENSRDDIGGSWDARVYKFCYFQ